MYCKKCGNEIKESAKFCTNCGASTASTSNQALVQPGTQSGASPKNVSVNGTSTSSKKMNLQQKIQMNCADVIFLIGVISLGISRILSIVYSLDNYDAKSVHKAFNSLLKYNVASYWSIKVLYILQWVELLLWVIIAIGFLLIYIDANSKSSKFATRGFACVRKGMWISVVIYILACVLAIINNMAICYSEELGMLEFLEQDGVISALLFQLVVGLVMVVFMIENAGIIGKYEDALLGRIEHMTKSNVVIINYIFIFLIVAFAIYSKDAEEESVIVNMTQSANTSSTFILIATAVAIFAFTYKIMKINEEAE